eukprot:96788_1
MYVVQNSIGQYRIVYWKICHNMLHYFYFNFTSVTSFNITIQPKVKTYDIISLITENRKKLIQSVKKHYKSHIDLELKTESTESDYYNFVIEDQDPLEQKCQ